MPRVSSNGGIIGKNLDFNSANTYLIEYVGGATLSSDTNNGVQTVTFANLTGGVGGGVLTGDLVIVSVACGNSNGVDLTMAMTTTGYTTLYDYYNGTRSDDINLGVHYKFMGATPDTNAITNITGLSTSDTTAIAVQVWRGVSTVTPIGAYNIATGQGSNANPPSITTTSPLSRVIAIGGTAHSDGAGYIFTQGGDLENFITFAVNDSTDVSLGVGSIIGNITSSGTSVDPIVWTKISSQNGNSWAATTIELIAKNLNAATKRNSGVWDIGWRYGSVAS